MRSLPPSTFFASSETLVTPSGNRRAETQLARDPFETSAHTAALCNANVILAPLVVVWDYKVPDARAFSGWLATKDILLKEARLSQDPQLCGVKYGGTYRVMRPDDADVARFRTHWGYANEEAMQAMHNLCSGDYGRATIAQVDLMEFVAGLKGFVSLAGNEHFEQNVLVASAITDS